MGVNLAAFRRYFLRSDRKTLPNLLLPLLGFVICLWIWLSLRTTAKVVGLSWLCTGFLYGLWKTRGFRQKMEFAQADEV
jgi:hypothetical protein